MSVQGCQTQEQSLAIAEALDMRDANSRLESADHTQMHPFNWL
jgi:hypothetical protein